MKTVSGYLVQVHMASLWAGLPFCAVVLLVDGFSRYLLACGSVAQELQACALPCLIEVGVCELALPAHDEKRYGLFEPLLYIEAIVGKGSE